MFDSDPQIDIQDIKQTLSMASNTPSELQNKVNLLFSLEALESHGKDPQIKTIIDNLFLQALPYMDASAEKIIDKIRGNYSTIVVELGMFHLLKDHGFDLITRDHSTSKKNNASNTPDFSFNNKENEHYFECTTRASSLIDFFFKLLPKFESYLLVAQLFARKHDDLKTIYTGLGNTFWSTSIEVLSHEFSEAEKQSIVNTLGFDSFKEAKNDFITWVYYVRYACMYNKRIIAPSLINDLKQIDFPIGSIDGNQDTIAQSLKHATKCVAQAIIDKMAKNYFQNDKPVTLAISFSLKSDFLTVPCPLVLMAYLKTNLSEILKAQAEIKKIKFNIADSLTNLYAIVLDTCWYNLLPTIAIERHAAKFLDGFTNNYACLYNANHPLVSKGMLIYSKIPYQDFISIEL
ncbi:TPA: hypothetical protein U0Z67_000831 [Legionella pneumophila]|nr:hypothetical protein [Legionella pneumophila]